MSRDFIPSGSEQPAVFESAVNVEQTEGGRGEAGERGRIHPQKRKKRHPSSGERRRSNKNVFTSQDVENECRRAEVHRATWKQTTKLVLFTIQLTAHQLHAQRARSAANHRDDANVLGHNGRLKEVGLGAVVICVPNKDLGHGNKR